MILGQLAVLPKHDWQGKTFDETTLVPPLGSGPYKVDSFEVGRYVDLSPGSQLLGLRSCRSRSAPTIGARARFDYYKDPNVALIAFLAGAYDMTVEASAKSWATAI